MPCPPVSLPRALCLVLPLLGALVLPYRAVAELRQERTLSPYFVVPNAAEGVEALPLKATSAVVDIAGVIADVKVTQTYQNTGQRPLEAVYVFPGSTRAAVYSMTMRIGARVRRAKIQERQAARAMYQAAKAEGKSASLLEQQRPNVFQMQVANILPGDEITVELAYTELLMPTEGTYTFLYPTVVGPRYATPSSRHAPASERWLAQPSLRAGTLPHYEFRLIVHLTTGLPVQEVASPSHKVTVTHQEPSRATITLADTEQAGGNRDFILQYRLQGGQIESGLLLYQGEAENVFLLMIQPPKRVLPQHLPPREYLFIVDVSGSMHGFPLDISKRLLIDLLTSVRPTDTFNVLLFAGSSDVLAEEPLPATGANVQRAVGWLKEQQGSGSTELLPALRRAMQMPQGEHTSRTIVIATDGYVSVEAEAFDLVRRHLNQANVFAFGIGTAVNHYLIEGLARAGAGEPFVITHQAEARAAADRFRAYVQTPVLTDIQINYGGFEVYDVEPLSLPDVFAERPVIIFGKWRGTPQGQITIQGRQGAQPYTKTIAVDAITPLPQHAALRYLWARHRITTLDDYDHLRPDPQRTAQITQLGLQYNLLTRYTSFIAVDDLVRTASGGDSPTVTQPLPLPVGVSNYAVGGSVPTVPEPETYLLLGVLGGLLLWRLASRRQGLRGLGDRLRAWTARV